MKIDNLKKKPFSFFGNWRVILFLGIIFSLGVEFTMIFVIKANPYHWDSYEYLSLAQNISQNKTFALHDNTLDNGKPFNRETHTRMRQPLYPLLLTFFYWQTGKNILLVQAVQCVMGIACFILWFFTARRLLGPKKGTIAGILIALYIPLWMLSVYIISDTMFMTGQSIAIFLLLYALTSRRVLAFSALAGFFFGISVLIRPTALLLPFVSLVPLVLWLGRRKALKPSVVMLTFFALTIAPWAIRNKIQTGTFSPLSTEAGFNLWAGTVKGCTDARLTSKEFHIAEANDYYISQNASDRLMKVAIKNITANPAMYVLRGIARTRTWFFSPVPLPNPQSIPFNIIQCGIMIFAGIGLWRTGFKTGSFLLLAAIPIQISVFAMNSNSRYFLPTIPFILMLSTEGIAYCVMRYRGAKFRNP